MSKSQLMVPAKPSPLHRILGRKGNILQWFTQQGWDLIPHEIRFSPQGKQERLVKGGWVQVKEEDFEAPPAPLQPQDVAPKDAKAVVETTGKDGNKPDHGGQSGPEAEEKTESKAPEKAGGKADKK